MSETLNILNSIVASATPLVIASLGETITERAGMINLSLNGSMMLAAMVGFVAAYSTNSLLIGLIAAILVGMLVALLIAFGTIYLRQDQVALGFVLTLLAADLSKFLGSPFNNTPGPTIPDLALPLLRDIPILGPIFFEQDVMVYTSYILLFGLWLWLFRTRPGLEHRAIGERPEAAFARGTQVNALRYLYMVMGGALIGLAGAGYSLNIKAGWSASPPMDGDGWIALAIVIFGGWHPYRVVLGAYLFAGLRAAASAIQRDPTVYLAPEAFVIGGVLVVGIVVMLGMRHGWERVLFRPRLLIVVGVLAAAFLAGFQPGATFDIPLVLLNALPWLLMILTLMLVSGGVIERVLRLLPAGLQNRFRQFLQSAPPAALGTRFEGK